MDERDLGPPPLLHMEELAMLDYQDHGATGFPVVNIEFALQRGQQQPLICNAQSGSFQSHRCEGSLLLA
jgi:hypothetical protein